MRTPLPLFLVLLLLLTACGEAHTAEDDPLEADTWTLEEDLRIDEEDDFFLARPVNMDVAEDGTMYLADAGDHHIKVLSPEGDLIETIGREGEGPGEFNGPRDVKLGRGDSLFVLSGQGRISVFEPGSHVFARSFDLDRTGGFGYPLSFFVPDDGFVIQATNLSQEGGPEAKTIYWLNDRGQDGEWIAIPQHGPRNFRIPIEGGFMFGPVPFSRQLYVDGGPDGRLYHGVNDSLAITTSDLDGEMVNHWSLPVRPPEVTRDDIDEYLDGRSSQWREAVLEVGLEDTHPLFHRLVVDDERCVWLKRENVEPDAEVESQQVLWWVVSDEGELLAETYLPAEIHVAAIKNGYVYGVVREQNYLPAVVRYQIQR